MVISAQLFLLAATSVGTAAELVSASARSAFSASNGGENFRFVRLGLGLVVLRQLIRKRLIERSETVSRVLQSVTRVFFDLLESIFHFDDVLSRARRLLLVLRLHAGDDPPGRASIADAVSCHLIVAICLYGTTMLRFRDGSMLWIAPFSRT